MRPLRPSFVLVVASGLLASACAGATPVDVLDPLPTGSELSKTEPAPADATPAAEGSAAGVTPPRKTAGPSSPSVNDGPNDKNAPPEPDPEQACAVEAEPNDTPENATPFTACISGVVTGGRDVDLLRIVAPADARKMMIEQDEPNGRVVYRVIKESDLLALGLDGVSFVQDPTELRVTPGAAYIFRVTSGGFTNGDAKGDRPYELRVSFTNQH
jgi:hypothetical protein